jgi:hypothetical protein
MGWVVGERRAADRGLETLLVRVWQEAPPNNHNAGSGRVGSLQGYDEMASKDEGRCSPTRGACGAQVAGPNWDGMVSGTQGRLRGQMGDGQETDRDRGR